MEAIHLFDLAARQARYLSVGQAAVASNVANANTPGYKAQSVRPFADVLDQTQLQMVATQPDHLGVAAGDPPTTDLVNEDSWETTESGNSVSLEQEMIKAGDIHRDFALNTSLVKAFHGMLMASVKASS